MNDGNGIKSLVTLMRGLDALKAQLEDSEKVEEMNVGTYGLMVPLYYAPRGADSREVAAHKKTIDQIMRRRAKSTAQMMGVIRELLRDLATSEEMRRGPPVP